jgi:sugar phosphate permease
MQASAGEGGLGLTSEQVGWILASLKIAYGCGQFLNGQFAERFSPRRLLAMGMFGSAALNVLFGFGTGFYFLLFVWAANGYCQSLGWPPCMRVVGDWVPVARRGKAIGIIGTGYQVTLGLTYFVAGQAAEALGWRGALLVPAGLLAAAGLFMLFALRESPGEGAAGSRPTQESAQAAARGTWFENLLLTLSNPALWLFGLSLGLLNACRYGFLDWGVSHLMKVQSIGVGKAGLTYVVLAIGAVAGSFLAGLATDRFFGGRRAPVICLLLVALGGLTLIYESVARHSGWGTVVLLVCIGFCIYGPQVLLVGTAPVDLARRGTGAAAAGFVNFVGYMGASAGDIVTGHFKMPEHGGWQVAIYIWAGWAFAAAVFAGLLWNATAHNEERS